MSNFKATILWFNFDDVASIKIILISPLNFGFMTIEHQDKEIYLLITVTQVALHLTI